MRTDAIKHLQLASAAASHKRVKFANKVTIDARHQKALDILIDLPPGNSETGIQLCINGMLQPHIKVPAQLRYAMVLRLKITKTARSSSKKSSPDIKS